MKWGRPMACGGLVGRQRGPRDPAQAEGLPHNILYPNATEPISRCTMYFTFTADEFSIVTIPRARRGERFC